MNLPNASAQPLLNVTSAFKHLRVGDVNPIQYLPSIVWTQSLIGGDAEALGARVSE